MITEYEKAKIKELRELFLSNAIQVLGEDVMATLDALFAIREGKPWRGLTDPKEIARAVLRQGKIGE